MTTAVYLDIDRVLSPINDSELWPDYELVEDAPFGGVLLSPSMLRRIAAVPAELFIVSDWLERDAQVIIDRLRPDATYLHRVSAESGIRGKLDTIAHHLASRPDIDRFVWADDHLSRGDDEGAPWSVSVEAVAVESRAKKQLLIPEDGLTPTQVRELERFCGV